MSKNNFFIETNDWVNVIFKIIDNKGSLRLM